MEHVPPNGIQEGEQSENPDVHSPLLSLRCDLCSVSFQHRHVYKYSITVPYQEQANRLSRHMKKHNRPYQCKIAECSSSFSLRLDLIRHQHSVHNTIFPEKRYYCEVSGCKYNKDASKSFTRKDHFDRHMKTHYLTSHHKIQGLSPPTSLLSLKNRAETLSNQNDVSDSVGGTSNDYNGSNLELALSKNQNRSDQRLSGDISANFQPVDFPQTDAEGFWLVPFPRNPNFTGRDVELERAEESLFAGSQPSRVALVGLGGVGKTQIALELVYRAREKHKNCSVIWIPATNMESLHQAYLDVAQQLGIPRCKEDGVDFKRLVQDFLSKDSTGQWLMVFDNADDIEMWTAKAEGESARLIDYLPRSKQGSIIFTTRDRKAALTLAHQSVMEVQEMNQEVAMQLLQTCLLDRHLINNQQATMELLVELTRLPLAITQAAAYINQNGITIVDYLSLLKEQEEEVVDLFSEEFEDEGRYRNVKSSVATTWLISFEQIRHHNSLAAEYMSFMACIDPKGIPQALLPEGPSRKKEIDAIGVLSAYSFISRRSADLSFDLHPLIHLAMRNWLRKQELLTQWSEKAILRLREMLPDNHHQNRRMWRIYLPHARYALKSDLVQKDEESRIDLNWRFGMCLFSDGRYFEAGISFMQVMETRKRVLGEEHPDTLTSMANLASTYRNQGRWNEAEDLEVQVMEMRKRVLGEEHPDTLTSIANLALTMWNQGRWKEAEDFEVMVMETRKRVLGPEHPNTLTIVSNLALTFLNQGRWKEAEELEIQVMDTRKRVLGVEHPDTLTSIANLASTYWNQGRWKEAKELEVQVMETSKRVLGQDHPDTLTSMANLASTYRNQGRWNEAEELFLQVKETSSRVLGEEHPLTLTSKASLASTFWNQGRWKEAQELFAQVIEMRKRMLGVEHPDTLTSMANLASTYWNQGRWKEAEDLEVQVMETKKRMLGVEHPDTLISMANLASTFCNQGRWEEAEDLEVQVIDMRKRILGVQHPDTLISMANLALTFCNQGRWEEAEDLEVQVMETRKRVLGQEHPDTLTSMRNLAFTWKVCGREKEALKLMELCVAAQTRILGTSHPSTLSSSAALLEWQIEE